MGGIRIRGLIADVNFVEKLFIVLRAQFYPKLQNCATIIFWCTWKKTRALILTLCQFHMLSRRLTTENILFKKSNIDTRPFWSTFNGISTTGLFKYPFIIHISMSQQLTRHLLFIVCILMFGTKMKLTAFGKYINIILAVPTQHVNWKIYY